MGTVGKSSAAGVAPMQPAVISPWWDDRSHRDRGLARTAEAGLPTPQMRKSNSGKKAFVMQRWIILPFGALLSTCLSAAPQTPPIHVVLLQESPALSLIVVRVVPARLPPAPSPSPQPAEKSLVSLTARLAPAEGPAQGLKRLFSAEVVNTMFVTELGIPIFQLPGRRLHLHGFASKHYMENVLLGPSGLGHPGVWLPRPSWTGGISLKFRLGRDAQPERRIGGWRGLSGMVGTSRDRRP